MLSLINNTNSKTKQQIGNPQKSKFEIKYSKFKNSKNQKSKNEHLTNQQIKNPKKEKQNTKQNFENSKIRKFCKET